MKERGLSNVGRGGTSLIYYPYSKSSSHIAVPSGNMFAHANSSNHLYKFEQYKQHWRIWSKCFPLHFYLRWITNPDDMGFPVVFSRDNPTYAGPISRSERGFRRDRLIVWRIFSSTRRCPRVFEINIPRRCETDSGDKDELYRLAGRLSTLTVSTPTYIIKSLDVYNRRRRRHNYSVLRTDPSER